MVERKKSGRARRIYEGEEEERGSGASVDETGVKREGWWPRGKV